MRIPAKCDRCQIIFMSGIDMAYGSTARLENCRQNCPLCYEFAHIIDGTFKHIEAGIALVDGPEDSRQVLQMIGRAISDIKSRNRPKDQVLANLKEVNPEAAKALREWLMIGLSFASLVLAIMVAYSDWKDRPSNQTKEEIIEQAYHEHLDEARRSHKFIGSPRPPERPENALFHQHPDTQPAQENRQSRRAKRAEEKRRPR